MRNHNALQLELVDRYVDDAEGRGAACTRCGREVTATTAVPGVAGATPEFAVMPRAMASARFAPSSRVNHPKEFAMKALLMSAVVLTFAAPAFAGETESLLDMLRHPQTPALTSVLDASEPVSEAALEAVVPRDTLRVTRNIEVAPARYRGMRMTRGRQVELPSEAKH